MLRLPEPHEARLIKPVGALGPYEVLAPIGAGGMGEVYRARDAKLSRDVAIKVLPELVSRVCPKRRTFQMVAPASQDHGRTPPEPGQPGVVASCCA